MTLGERIKELDPNTYVYAGCEDGCGFFFIGKPFEFDSFIGDMEQYIISGYMNLIEKALKDGRKSCDERHELEDKYESVENDEYEWRQYIKDALQYDYVDCSKLLKLEEKHIEYLKDMKEQRAVLDKLKRSEDRAVQRAENYNALIRKWTPLSDTKVVEEFPHTVEPEGITLLVAGDIQGDFSLRKDFEAWVRKIQKQKAREE